MTLTSNPRKVAIALAFAGALPTPVPLTWLHKFYLGQYLWGAVYLALGFTLLPQVACCFEGIWYLTQNDASFLARFPKAGTLLPVGDSAEPAIAVTQAQSPKPDKTARQVASALRDLEQLRQDGLMTEYEFEQKRRQLLARID